MAKLALPVLPAALLSAVLLPSDPGPAPAAPPDPPPLFTPARAVAPALADVRTLPGQLRKQARYISGHFAEDEEEALWWGRRLAHAFNSWSRNIVTVRPVAVAGGDGRLWRVLLSDYRIDPAVYDHELVLKGSGRVPVPEPYFRFVGEAEGVPEYRTDTYGYYEDGAGGRLPANTPERDAASRGYRWHTTRTERVRVGTARRGEVLAQPGWLPKKELAELILETGSEAALVRADWLLYYGFLEPAYHKLLGLDDTEQSFRKLAGAPGVKAAEETVELGSVVLESEVAVNNRALFREATRKRHGRGYWWESRDFDKSIRADDILQDPSLIKPVAKEVIFSLPNGLQGYGVFDANGKRLDRAAVEVAKDTRNGFRSVEVEIRNCVCCHARGLIEIDDEVRGFSQDQVKLALRQADRKDHQKALFVADRYFSADINQVVAADQANYDAAVRSCNGLAAAANALAARRAMLRYERVLTLAGLPRETGYPPAVVLGVLERAAAAGLDHSASRLAQRKRPGGRAPQSRRDQYEATGHGQLMTLLSRVPVEAPPPKARPGKDPVADAAARERELGRLRRIIRDARAKED